MIRKWRSLGLLMMAFFLALSCSAPTEAKTINLGGKSKDKMSAFRIIELPSINVAMPKGDVNNGWRHIRIDAYIMPKDEQTGLMLDGVKSSIVKHATEETVPATGYDKLHSPYGGEEAAKKAIRIAAERALGHPFEGEIEIKTFLSY